jgi:hypothetical protein
VKEALAAASLALATFRLAITIIVIVDMGDLELKHQRNNL